MSSLHFGRINRAAAVKKLMETINVDTVISELQKKLKASEKPLSVGCNVCCINDLTKLTQCSQCRHLFCDTCWKNRDSHSCKNCLKMPVDENSDKNALSLAHIFGVDMCEKHAKIREFFCTTCDTALCGHCVFDKSKSHATHEVGDRAMLVTQSEKLAEVIDYAESVETHQSLSSRICLEELFRLKTETERNAIVWLAFADRVVNFVESFIQDKISSVARAKAQHLLAQGVVTCDAAATNRRLIDYMKSVQNAEPDSVEGILAHCVFRRLESVIEEPCVLTGYAKETSSPVGEEGISTDFDSDTFDKALEKLSGVFDELANKFLLTDEHTASDAIASNISLKSLKNASADDMDENKEYKFRDDLLASDNMPPELPNETEAVTVPSASVDYDEDAASIISSTASRPTTTTTNSASVSKSTKKRETEPHLLDYMPCLNLESGDHVLVTSIKSPTDFYVQKLRLYQVFQHINSACANAGKLKSKSKAVFKVDMPVLAQYSVNNRWYRARISDARVVDPDVNDAKEFLVQYIDFGNKEWILEGSGRLHGIPQSLLAHPPQAIHCSLHNIVPNTADGQWTDAAIEALEQMFAALSATVCVCRDPASQGLVNAPWQIDLYRNSQSSSRAPESFRDALIFLGHGCFPSEYFVISPLNAPAAKGTSSACATITNISSGGMSTKGKNRIKYRYPENLKMNEIYAIVLVHVDSPWQFYIHVLGEEISGMTQLNREIEKYITLKRSKNDVFTPALRGGLPVIAQYALDGKWYRAVVIRADENMRGRVVVKFVDYGNEAAVDIRRVLEMPESFMKYPVQAVKCRLSGVRPCTGQWTPEAGKWLFSVCTKPGNFLDMLVVGVAKAGHQSYLVELFEDEDNGVSKKALADAMINANLAVKDVEDPPEFHCENSIPVPSRPQQPPPQPVVPTLPRFVSAPKPPKPKKKMEARLSEKSVSTNDKHSSIEVENPEVEPEPLAVQVVVTHISNPHDFYVRPVKLNALVDRIERGLKLLVEGNLTSGVGVAANGDLVLMHDEIDGKWKRSRVAGLATVSADELVDVFLLDYGSFRGVAMSNLCKICTPTPGCLAETLFQLPPTVFNCALDGIKPAGMSGNLWARKATELFTDATCPQDDETVTPKKMETWAVTSGVRLTDGRLKDKIPVRIYNKNVIPATAFTAEGRKYVTLNSQLLDEGVALSDVQVISADASPQQLLTSSQGAFSFSIPPDVASAVARPLYALNIDSLTTNSAESASSEPSSLALPGMSSGERQKQQQQQQQQLQQQEQLEDNQSKDGNVLRRVDIFAGGSPVPVKVEQAILHAMDFSEGVFHFLDKEAMDGIDEKCQALAEKLNSPEDASGLDIGSFVLAADNLQDGWWYRALIKQLDVPFEASVAPSDGEDDSNDTQSTSANTAVEVYFVDLGTCRNVLLDDVRVVQKSPAADDLANIACAHFPVVLPVIRLAWALDTLPVGLPELLEGFTFSLSIFAPLRQSLTEIVHGGISAYLATAFISYRPSTASRETPAVGDELAHFLCQQGYAFDDASTTSPRLTLAYPLPNEFPPGKAVSVLISHVNSMDRLWVQRKSDATERAILAMKNRIIQTAESLPSVASDQIVPWMPLIVKWPVDNGWYRAVCISRDSFVHILFVDYGNEDHVPFSCCRLMPPRLHALPPFAMPVCLSDKTKKSLQPATQQKLLNLCCLVRNTGGMTPAGLPSVDLLKVDPSNSEDVTFLR